jgi:hypothetical protein
VGVALWWLSLPQFAEAGVKSLHAGIFLAQRDDGETGGGVEADTVCVGFSDQGQGGRSSLPNRREESTSHPGPPHGCAVAMCSRVVLESPTV